MIGGSGGGRTYRRTVRIAGVRTIILSALTVTNYRIISLPVAVLTAINFVLGNGNGTTPTMIGDGGGRRTHRRTVRIAGVRTIILSALTVTNYRIISLPVAVSTAINFVLGNGSYGTRRSYSDAPVATSTCQ